MGTTTAPQSPDLRPTRSRSLRQEAAFGAVAVTAANVAIWLSGRAADVPFMVKSPALESATQVDLVAVALTTPIMFALGTWLYALAARRSDGWARAVVAVGVLVAVVSAGGAFAVAEDGSTGVLLASMHLLTGAAFFAIVSQRRTR